MRAPSENFRDSVWASSDLGLTLGLLQQIVTPVGEVEDGEDGGEDDARDHVDLLRPRGELGQPGLQEVEVLLLRLVHVDLALVQLVHHVDLLLRGVGGEGAARGAHHARDARRVAG